MKLKLRQDGGRQTGLTSFRTRQTTKLRVQLAKVNKLRREITELRRLIITQPRTRGGEVALPKKTIGGQLRDPQRWHRFRDLLGQPGTQVQNMWMQFGR